MLQLFLTTTHVQLFKHALLSYSLITVFTEIAGNCLLPVSHLFPTNPGGQLQLKPFISSLHLPLLRQGLLSHSLISAGKSHDFIVNKLTQCSVIFPVFMVVQCHLTELSKALHKMLPIVKKRCSNLLRKLLKSW